MPKNLKNIILLITCLVSSWSFSQMHPMQVSAQMIPPYSLKLSDYTTAMNERIVATLLLTDIREQNMQIGIRLYIENGRNIAIRSSPAVSGATPLYISGGIPLRLSNLDLRPYFQLENLQGISPQQYNQPLPDGLYQFCFEVYEWVSGETLSRKSCATAYLVLNDPPILNFPNRGELIAHKDPQNIIFQWTPRHLNATNVQYEFTLTELWDNQMDPQAAFLASRPLYQTITRANTLLYGPGETALLPDKNYAWRVRALVSDGISETSVFKNDGYSEIFHFTHTGNCDEPAFILAKADSPTSEKIMWQGLGHLKYKVQFRKKSPSDVQSRWHQINAYNEYTTLYNLEGGTAYEFRVGGQCNENAGYTYSQVYEFTTALPNQALSYNCGITPEIEITNRELLGSLAVNDVFTAGDFPVTVTSVNPSPFGGGWVGAGYIVVPYLQDTKVRVSFNNIKINTDYQFIEGIIETDYDPTWGGMDDTRDEIEAAAQIPQAIVDLANAIDKELDQLIESIQQGIELNQNTNNFIDLMTESLSDPNTGLTEEQKQNLQNYISDKDNVKEAIKKAQEEIADGKHDEIIKQNLVSNLMNPGDSDSPNIESNQELSLNTFEQLDNIFENVSENRIYISPAGVPVTLPKEAKPRFLKSNNLKVAYGVLSGFTLNDSIYNGYFTGNKFNGYKTKKGGQPYKCIPIADTRNIIAIAIQPILYMDCSYFVVKGKYTASILNETGEGNLLINKKLRFDGEAELVEDFTGYTTCLPEVSRDAFDEYIWGHYNYFGRGGFIRAVQNSKGKISYLYTVPEGENGEIISFQYHTDEGKWYAFNEPAYDCLSCDIEYLFKALLSAEAGHFVLDGLGMVPIVGEAFDAVNGVWYIIEGDGVNATISFASTIPLVYLTTVKNMGKIVKLADGTYSTIKLSSKEAEAFLKQLQKHKFDKQTLEALNKDLNNKAFAEAVAKNPELVDAWKVIEGNPILRKKPENLKNISKWLDEGIEPQKLGDGIAKSRSKQKLIDDLGIAKSQLHARVLIKDYDNIPGVVKGKYISNGSALTDKANLLHGWKIEVDLPEGEIKNFTGKIEPLELKPGDKIYRISHSHGAGGAYWTRTKPEKLDDVIGGTAVQPEWNNFEYIHEYVVPKGKTIKTWLGKTARQQVSEVVPSNYYLPGGDEQLFINYIGKQDPDFQSIVKSTKAEW